MTNPPILFIDCETLGLGDAPVWEVAAIRVDGRDFRGPVVTRYQSFVRHEFDEAYFDDLPMPFRVDYENRYDEDRAWPHQSVIDQLQGLAVGDAIVVGSNPSFDMTRLEAMAAALGEKIPWHYHPIDVPTLAHGWLLGKGIFPAAPWKSDLLSQMCGIDPREFDRHTAMGDCNWMLALWRVITS